MKNENMEKRIEETNAWIDDLRHDIEDRQEDLMDAYMNILLNIFERIHEGGITNYQARMIKDQVRKIADITEAIMEVWGINNEKNIKQMIGYLMTASTTYEEMYLEDKILAVNGLAENLLEVI